MAKMKAVQPMMATLRERYPDDKVKQQQEMMEIYRKEKINPLVERI
jgi:YidC/Oxa1 family membrane protein insertase